jgi:anthranilate phosphoribosyltransferase
MSFKTLITQCLDSSLSYEQAFDAFLDLMQGKFTPVQSAAFLSVLATRGEYIDEYAAAAAAMRNHGIKIKAPAGAIDIVGTGGDGKSTLNISTATAFVVAGAGVCVAKHGNKAVSSASGAADVLTASDINVMVKPQRAEEILQKTGIMFLMASVYHPAMKAIAPIRAEIGIRTIFNILGPLTNPANVSRQLTGAFSRHLLKPMAQTLQKLGTTQRAWFVHGADGTDEASITGETHTVILDNNTISEMTLHPDMAGLPVHKLEDIVGGSATENALALKNLLEGQTGAYRDAVLFNAAAALVIAGKASTLKEGVEQARESLDSQKALQTFRNLQQETNR